MVQLPRGQGSRDTLVGHLGNVTVRNEYCTVDQTDVHKVASTVDVRYLSKHFTLFETDYKILNQFKN